VEGVNNTGKGPMDRKGKRTRAEVPKILETSELRVIAYRGLHSELLLGKRFEPESTL